MEIRGRIPCKNGLAHHHHFSCLLSRRHYYLKVECGDKSGKNIRARVDNDQTSKDSWELSLRDTKIHQRENARTIDHRRIDYSTNDEGNTERHNFFFRRQRDQTKTEGRLKYKKTPNMETKKR